MKKTYPKPAQRYDKNEAPVIDIAADDRLPNLCKTYINYMGMNPDVMV